MVSGGSPVRWSLRGWAVTLVTCAALLWQAAPASSTTLMVEDLPNLGHTETPLTGLGHYYAHYMGARMIRYHHGLEANHPDHFNLYFQRVDAWLARTEAAGFRPYLTITYQPHTYVQLPSATDFGAFCRTIATRYGARIADYSVWNEPNQPGTTPLLAGAGAATYNSLYRSCYSNIKDVQPAAKVYYGEIDAHRLNSCAYVQDAIDNGGTTLTDGIALHTYQWKSDPDVASEPHLCQGIGRLPEWNISRQSWSNSNYLRTPQGGAPPILISEHGYCDSHGECPREAGTANSIADESERGEKARRAFTWAESNGVAVFSYYHLFNQPDPSSGTLWDTGIVGLDGTPTPSVSQLWLATGARVDGPGVMRPSTGVWYLRNSNTTGISNYAPSFGLGAQRVVAGDWDGDGRDSIGKFYSSAWWHLANSVIGTPPVSHELNFGLGGDMPVAGDWDGDGDDSIGVFRSGSANWYLRNSNSGGAPDHSFAYGLAGDVGVAGDWDGDGRDSIGIYRPSTAAWHLSNAVTGGPPVHYQAAYGIAGDVPVVGDWDGDGRDSIGVFRPSTGMWYLSNTIANAQTHLSMSFGTSGDMPVTGNWDGF